MTRQSFSVSEHIVNRITHALADAAYSQKTPLVVAYSGGVDSSVLLQAVVDYRDQFDCPIHAVHVHHGLSINADHWAQHCELQCRLNDITFHLHHVDVAKGARQSLEAEARKARYKELLQVCRSVNGVLLLGQHAQDQLETVLLQLKRGAGPQGLSGMGEAQLREGVLVVRPMLALEKQDIIQYAEDESLKWIEDESNTQNSFDRNFLRNEIIPQLMSRWPKLTKTVGRSAMLCAQQTELVNETALAHLDTVKHNDKRLNGERLATLNVPWQSAVVRAWFTSHKVLVPSKAQLDEILAMLHAKPDATPEVLFNWGKVARFNGDLFWVEHAKHPAESEITLTANEPCYLPWLQGNIRVEVSTENDSGEIVLKTNQRGLKVKPSSSSVSKTLKDWFKVWRVPLWERSQVPVIFVNGVPVGLIVDNACVYLTTCNSDIKITFSRDL